MEGWKEAARVGVRKKQKHTNRKAIHRRGKRQETIQRELGGRDRSRFFLSKTKGRFKKPSPATPWPAHFFLVEFRCPSLGVRVFRPLPPAFSRLSLFARSPQLSFARLSPSPLPLYRSSLRPPPSPCSAPSPPLSRPRPSPPPGARRWGSQAAGGAGRGRAAKQRHSAAAAARRRRRATPAERRALPSALPRTDLLPGPETNLLPSKPPSSWHPTPRGRAAPSKPPAPPPQPTGRGGLGRGQRKPEGVESWTPEPSRGLEEGL